MQGHDNEAARAVGARCIAAARTSRTRSRVGGALIALAVGLLWIAWPAGASAASPGEPHWTMTSSQIACQVCHLSNPVIFSSLEASASSIGPVSDAACIACHVESGGPGPKVYDGDEAHYRLEDPFGHNDPSKAGCLDCHSVHGPHIEAPALTGKLLKDLDYQPAALRETDLSIASHDVALSVWCTGCHELWPGRATGSHAPGAAISVVDQPSTGHPFAPKRAGSSWADCDSCLSCHAARGGFPHYTAGADAGLVGAASASEPRVGTPERFSDGVCLACHRGSTASGLAGVGITY